MAKICLASSRRNEFFPKGQKHSVQQVMKSMISAIHQQKALLSNGATLTVIIWTGHPQNTGNIPDHSMAESQFRNYSTAMGLLR
ncbi:hypothetical protein [Prevotella multiformis]|nr:hypothetical protein [Prevotella multiformis]